jgi:hypothetical protein
MTSLPGIEIHVPLHKLDEGNLRRSLGSDSISIHLNLCKSQLIWNIFWLNQYSNLLCNGEQDQFTTAMPGPCHSGGMYLNYRYSFREGSKRREHTTFRTSWNKNDCPVSHVESGLGLSLPLLIYLLHKTFVAKNVPILGQNYRGQRKSGDHLGILN